MWPGFPEEVRARRGLEGGQDPSSALWSPVCVFQEGRGSQQWPEQRWTGCPGAERRLA